MAARSGDGDFETRRETFTVTNATATSFTLQQIQVSGSQTRTEQGTVAISGTTVTYARTCPAPGDGGNSRGFRSVRRQTPTTFTLILLPVGRHPGARLYEELDKRDEGAACARRLGRGDHHLRSWSARRRSSSFTLRRAAPRSVC